MLLLWLGVVIVGWPSRRGRTAKRLQALRNKASTVTPRIDVSAAGAAAIVANRVRVGIEISGALAIILLVALDVPRLTGGLVLLMIVAAIHRFEFPAAQGIYLRLTGHPHAGLTREAYRYNIVDEHTGGFRRLARRFTMAEPIRILGSALLLAAGLVVYYGSDVIPTGIPGLVVPARELSSLVIAGILMTVGLILIWGGTKLERVLRRYEMRKVTTLEDVHHPVQRTILFLRRFGTEEVPVPRHAAARDLGFIPALVPKRSIYFEEATLWACWALGIVISVSDPRHVRDRVLATGRHAIPTDTEWQGVVTELIRHSALIVLVVGKNEDVDWEKETGTRWEMKTIAGEPDTAAKAIFLNAYPGEPAAFQEEIERLSAPHLDVKMIRDVPRDRKLIGVVFSGGRAVPVVSNLAEDVDYEAAVQWAARRVGLARGDRPQPE